jgi:hypothetical protein
VDGDNDSGSQYLGEDTDNPLSSLSRRLLDLI